MKKKIAVFLALAMLLTMMVAPAMAGDVKVIVDGQSVTFTQPPIIENGSTLVPMRAIFEAMGATVTWDQATKTATGVKGSTTVILPIGSTSPTINGAAKTIAVPGKVVNGSTLAPLRFIGEAFGGTVTWDQATMTATIISAKTTAPTDATTPVVTPPAAAASASDSVKAAIAAFKPASCSFTVNATVKGTSVGDVNVKIAGKGDIAADKASSNWTGEMGALGNSSPTGTFCPFSELIAGPEASAVAVVNGGTIADNVITVTNVPIPASLKSVLDNTSTMVPVAFTVTMDAKIKIDKATGRIVEIQITALKGTGAALGKDLPASGTGTFTYTY